MHNSHLKSKNVRCAAEVAGVQDVEPISFGQPHSHGFLEKHQEFHFVSATCAAVVHRV